jgi:hypothetical protein
MNAHNRPIYHCLCCGHVIVTEPAALAPFCCGREMTRAAEETCDAQDEVAVTSKNVEHSARRDARGFTKDRGPTRMRSDASLV